MSEGFENQFYQSLRAAEKRGENFFILPSKALFFDRKNLQFGFHDGQHNAQVSVSNHEEIIKRIHVSFEAGAFDYSKTEEYNGILINTFGLASVPFLREAISRLSEEEAKAIRTEVITVMREVFNAVDPERYKIITKHEPKNNPDENPGHIGFSVQFDSERGTFRLQTFGNCACMGTLYDDSGSVVALKRSLEPDDISCAQGYGTHNIDINAQEASILAGAAVLGQYVMECERGRTKNTL